MASPTVLPGPVLVAIPFEDEEDAIRIANDTVYGLGHKYSLKYLTPRPA